QVVITTYDTVRSEHNRLAPAIPRAKKKSPKRSGDLGGGSDESDSMDISESLDTAASDPEAIDLEAVVDPDPLALDDFPAAADALSISDDEKAASSPSPTT